MGILHHSYWSKPPTGININTTSRKFYKFIQYFVVPCLLHCYCYCYYLLLEKQKLKCMCTHTPLHHKHNHNKHQIIIHTNGTRRRCIYLLIPKHAHRDYSNIQRGRTMYVHIVPFTLNWEKSGKPEQPKRMNWYGVLFAFIQLCMSVCVCAEENFLCKYISF